MRKRIAKPVVVAFSFSTREYARGYNAVSAPVIAGRFGADVLERLGPSGTPESLDSEPWAPKNGSSSRPGFFAAKPPRHHKGSANQQLRSGALGGTFPGQFQG